MALGPGYKEGAVGMTSKSNPIEVSVIPDPAGAQFLRQLADAIDGAWAADRHNGVAVELPFIVREFDPESLFPLAVAVDQLDSVQHQHQGRAPAFKLKRLRFPDPPEVAFVGHVFDELWMSTDGDRDELRFRIQRADRSVVSVEVIGENAQRLAGSIRRCDRVQVVGSWRDGVLRADAVLPTDRWRRRRP